MLSTYIWHLQNEKKYIPLHQQVHAVYLILIVLLLMIGPFMFEKYDATLDELIRFGKLHTVENTN